MDPSNFVTLARGDLLTVMLFTVILLFVFTRR